MNILVAFHINIEAIYFILLEPLDFLVKWWKMIFFCLPYWGSFKTEFIFLEVYTKHYLIIYWAPLNSDVCWVYITTVKTLVKFQLEICNYNRQHTCTHVLPPLMNMYTILKFSWFYWLCVWKFTDSYETNEMFGNVIIVAKRICKGFWCVVLWAKLAQSSHVLLHQ